MSAQPTFWGSFTDWWSRRTLAQRFTMLTATLIAGSAIVQSVVLIAVSSHVVSDLAAGRVERRLEKAAAQFEQGVEEYSRMPLILAGTPPVPRIIALSDGAKPLPGESLEVWIDRLTIIFRSLVQATPNIVQVRLIGVADGGREIVRIDRIGGRLKAVKKSDLQQKGQRDYFKATIKLKPGEIYLSPINANIDQGAPTRPFEPVLRAATPVYGDDGKPFGMIVINTDFDLWFERIAEVSSLPGHFYVANQSGDYIFRSDGKPVLGSLDGQPDLFVRNLPPTGALFRPTAKTSTSFQLGDVFVAARRINYNPHNAADFVVIAGDTDPSINFGDKYRLTLIGTFLALTMAALGVLAAYIATRPLRNLMGAASAIAAGKLDVGVLDQDGRGADIGELGAALRIMKDAVERRELSLQKSEAQLKAIVDNTVDGLITIDSRGIIQRYNRGCTKVFGYRPDEAIGQNVSMLMPSPDAEKHDSYLARYERTGERRFIGVRREVVGRHKDGHLVDIEIAVAEIKVGGEVLYSGVVSDIGERKRIDRLKDEFVSSVSHELRTPLTAIMGSLGLLRAGALGTLPSGASNMLDLAQGNCARLMDLINEILDIDRIEHGGVTIDHNDENVMMLVAHSIAPLTGAASAKGVRISRDGVDETLRLTTDESHFQRVLGNLVENAIKFSPSGAEVRVEAHKRGRNVRISVSDEGPGIPKQFHPRVFDKFAQADASDRRETGGAGLGLYIAKTVVEQLGGSIGFETEVGKGSTFYFELPIEVTAGQSSGEDDVVPKLKHTA